MLLKKLNHPAIINIFGINFHSFKNEEILKPTILMEHIPKGTLSNLINLEKKGIVPEFWTFTKKFINLVGISHAMSCLHKNGVIYRDLKPDNIFVGEDFYPRIYNFTYCSFFSHPLDSSMLLLDRKF